MVPLSDGIKIAPSKQRPGSTVENNLKQIYKFAAEIRMEAGCPDHDDVLACTGIGAD
jgi:hypothetical protein